MLFAPLFFKNPRKQHAVALFFEGEVRRIPFERPTGPKASATVDYPRISSPGMVIWYHWGVRVFSPRPFSLLGCAGAIRTRPLFVRRFTTRRKTVNKFSSGLAIPLVLGLLAETSLALPIHSWQLVQQGGKGRGGIPPFTPLVAPLELSRK